VVERDLLAEHADVDVVVHPVRREPKRALTDEQRALADRTLLRLHRPHRLHGVPTIGHLQGFSPVKRAAFPWTV
jgi:hypothetical protein